MAVMNFFSRLTYENILSPMILARSGGSEYTLGIVSGVLGIGGILGGLLISLIELPKSIVKALYFSARNAIQYYTTPAGILLGGFLADYVFEPFMLSMNPFSELLQNFVGKGAGSGMAVMFLCTGILGSISCLLWSNNKFIQKLTDE